MAKYVFLSDIRSSSLLLSLTVSAGMMAASDGTRPNIILFMVDDMGWQDTSVPFWTQPTPLNKRYETPNMERLAAQGMLFTQAYASPISSPSRCSLLTGMYGRKAVSTGLKRSIRVH